jgi:hypothetical protein
VRQPILEHMGIVGAAGNRNRRCASLSAWAGWRCEADCLSLTPPSAAPSRPRRLRAMGAFLFGLLTIVVLSHGTDALLRAVGLYPEQGQLMSDSLFLLAASYRTLYGVLGCYLSARLAPQRPQAYALALWAAWGSSSACSERWPPGTREPSAVRTGIH